MRKFFLPTKFDVDLIIQFSNNQYVNNKTGEINKYTFDLKKINLEATRYILYLILKQTILKLNVLSDKSRYTSKEGFIFNDIYIEFPSKKLESIDRNYKQIMEFLCNSHMNYYNILYRSNYAPNKAFSYCINYKYINSDFSIHQIKKRSILKRIMEGNNIRIEGARINKELKHLKKDFLTKVKLDLEHLNTSLDSGNLINEFHSLFNLLDFYNGSKWMTIKDDKDGRLHSNLTNIKSKHRKLIRSSNNEKMVEVDVSSCVPYLFVLSILKCNQIPFKFNERLTNFQFIFSIVWRRFEENQTTEMLINELLILAKLTKENKFYSDLIKDTTLDKKDVLSLFFCKNGGKIEIENCFKSKYPNTYYFLTKLKDNETWIESYGFLPDYDSNKLLAHYLFHLEAELMIFNVTKEIKNINKKIEILTIHDGIMVSEGYSNLAKEVIGKVFKKYLVLIPHIKIK